MSNVTRPFSASNLAIRQTTHEGEEYSRWRVLGRDFIVNRNANVVAQCQCGCVAAVKIADLLAGRSKSCGCLAIEVNTKHGEGSCRRNEQSRLFNCWRNMKQRCTNPRRKDYRWYGAKGVQVCGEWAEDFAKFKEWAIEAGYQEDLTLDRVDASRDYEPDNCRWIPFSENLARSRRKKKVMT